MTQTQKKTKKKTKKKKKNKQLVHTHLRPPLRKINMCGNPVQHSPEITCDKK